MNKKQIIIEGLEAGIWALEVMLGRSDEPLTRQQLRKAKKALKEVK